MLSKDFIPNDEIYNENIIFYKTPENVLNHIKENEDKMNNRFDFTEGEWIINEFEVFPIEKLDIDDCVEITTKIIDHTSITIGHVYRHNAQLISCAPEMLNALIEIIKDYAETVELEENKDIYEEEKIKNHINLIEKATGKKWSEII